MDSKNTFRKKAIIINSPNGFDAIEIKGCMECDHLKNITPECNCEKVDCNIAPGRFRQWEWYGEIQAERPHFIFDDCPLFDWEDVRWHSIKEIPRDGALVAIKLKWNPNRNPTEKDRIPGVYARQRFFVEDPKQLRAYVTEKRQFGWSFECPTNLIESWRYLEY